MTVLRCAFAGVAGLALAGAAQAGDFTPKEKGVVMLNLRVTDIFSKADDPILTRAGAPTGLDVDVKHGLAPTVGLGFFLTDHVAVDLTLGSTRHAIKAKGPGTEVTVHRTWVLPPVIMLQYHFAPAGKVSPYVGAGVNYMIFYSGEDRNGFAVDLDDGFGAALQAGVDVAVRGAWSANLDVKKVFFKTDASINDGALKSSVKLNPWVVSAGVGYKF